MAKMKAELNKNSTNEEILAFRQSQDTYDMDKHQKVFHTQFQDTLLCFTEVWK